MKIIIVLLCLPLFYSCQLKEVKVYEKENVVKVDTLNIEQIKIPTH